MVDRGADARRHRQQPRPGPPLEHGHRHARATPRARARTRSTKDLSDARLDMFPDAKPNAYTTTELRGREGASPRATTATRSRTRPRTAPTRAFDGDVAHRVADRRVRRRARRPDPDRARPPDHDRPREPRPGARSRRTSATSPHATLTLRRWRRPVDVDLGPAVADRRRPDRDASRSARSARSRSRSATRTSASSIIYGGVSPVGFAEIRLRDDAPGAQAGAWCSEVVKMPTDLLSTVGHERRRSTRSCCS